MRKIGFWIALLLVVALLAGCFPSKKRNNQAEAHYILGLSYLKENNATLALKEFLDAQEVEPRDAEIQAALGQAYHLKKAYKEAEKHYLKALKYKPDDPQIENNFAALYLDMGQFDDSIRYFRKASANLLFTRAEVALTGMGFAYFQKGDYLEAVASYKEAIHVELRYPQAHLRLGEAYYALDKTDLAIKEFKEALKFFPDYAQAHYKLAIAYMKKQETEKAKKSFQEVVRLAHDSEIGRLAKDYLELLK